MNDPLAELQSQSAEPPVRRRECPCRKQGERPLRIHVGKTPMVRRVAHRDRVAREALMSMKRALQVVFTISLIGAAFSGTLTYRELTGATAQVCPSPGAPGTIFGYPACVYGLVMYAILAIVSGLGLMAESRRTSAHT